MITKMIDIQKDNFILEHYLYEEEKNHLFMTHSHNTYEILFFLRGSATYVIEDKKYFLKKNDLIFIRPNKYHYIQLDPSIPYERYDVQFDEDALHLDLQNLLPEHLEIRNCSNDIIYENFKKAAYYHEVLEEDAFIDLFQCLLKEILYNLGLSTKTDPVPSVISPLISHAVKYINDHLFTIEKISQISDSLFISEAYFFKIFKKELKISPQKYINEKRLLAAQKLLLSGKRPTDVYLQCGFQTYSAFYKRYVDFFGCAPSEALISELKS